MRDFLNVLQDIKSGALPAKEIPGFMIWLFWRPCVLLWLATVVIGVALWIAK